MKTFTLEIEQAEDGRWITTIPELLRVMNYGTTCDKTIAKAEALGLRVLAEDRGMAFQAMSHRQDADATPQ